MKELKEIEISATCESTDGHSLYFGWSIPENEWPSTDSSWIYEGVSDYISENWEEYEDVSNAVVQRCVQYYRENKAVPVSDKDVEKHCVQILKEIIGKFRTEYRINGELIQSPFEVTDEDISNAAYTVVIAIFPITSRVLCELKKK